jgi:hypothetical protein
LARTGDRVDAGRGDDMPRRLLFATVIAPLVAMLLAPVASASASAPAARPGSCASIKASHPRASLRCASTAAGGATIFLVLQRSGPGQNFSQFTAGGTISGTNVVTSYTALRLDPTPVSLSPVTYRVNIADQTYATTTGAACCIGSEAITSMPYGVAADCNTPGSSTGVADIDLTGTGFVIASSFATQGFEPGGSTVMLTPQIAALSGGGFCGWNSTPGLFNPINTDPLNDANGGFDLQISLQ